VSGLVSAVAWRVCAFPGLAGTLSRRAGASLWLAGAFCGLAVPSSRRSCRSGGCSAGAQIRGQLVVGWRGRGGPGLRRDVRLYPVLCCHPARLRRGDGRKRLVRASTAWGRAKDGGSTGRLIGTGGSRPWPAPGTRRGRDPGCLACAVWSWPGRSAGAAWSCGGACAPLPSSAARMRRMTDSGSTNGAGGPVPVACVSPRRRRGSGGTRLSSAIRPTPGSHTMARPCELDQHTIRYEATGKPGCCEAAM